MDSTETQTGTRNLWGKHPKTNRMKLYVFFMYVIDALVLSFLAVFMNQCQVDLGWTPWMKSLALGILPFAGVAGILILSVFSGDTKRNLRVLRICMFTVFGCILIMGFTGLFLGDGISERGEVDNSALYYGKYAIFLVMSCLIQALEGGMQPCASSVIADVNAQEGTTYGSIYSIISLVYIVSTPIGGLIAGLLKTSRGTFTGYLIMFLIMSPFALLAALWTWVMGRKKNLGLKDGDISNPEINSEDGSSSLQDYLDVFKNKVFVYFMAFTAIYAGIFFATDSVASEMWTNIGDVGEGVSTVFTPLNWGLMGSVGCLFELIFLNVATKFMKDDNQKTLMAFCPLLMGIRTAALGVLSIFFFNSAAGQDSWVAWVMMALQTLRGTSWGIFNAANVPMTDRILGSKLRQKGVFLIPLLYQVINGVIQFIFPLISGIGEGAQSGHLRFVVFFLISFLGLVSFLGLILMKNPSASSPEDQKPEEASE